MKAAEKNILKDLLEWNNETIKDLLYTETLMVKLINHKETQIDESNDDVEIKELITNKVDLECMIVRDKIYIKELADRNDAILKRLIK